MSEPVGTEIVLSDILLTPEIEVSKYELFFSPSIVISSVVIFSD